jgi:hypothetical protein
MVDSTTKKTVAHIAGTGFDNRDDWASQRNMKESVWDWMPAANRGLRQPILNKDTYFFDHNGNRIRLESNLSGDTQNGGAAHGMGQWNPNGSRSNVVSHSVNKNKPYVHWSVYGWDGGGKSTAQMNELKAAKCAPITNFIGFTFKWDGYGSNWNNRAIKMEPDHNVVRSPQNDNWGGASLNVYNAKTDQVHSMYVFRESYKGWDIFQDRLDNSGDTYTSDNNIVYWKMSTSDQEYVLNNPVFLIGINLQCYNDDRGSATHTRTLNFWDLNPIFNPAIGGSHNQGGAKMILPESYDGALGDMYKRFNRNTTVPMRVAIG